MAVFVIQRQSKTYVGTAQDKRAEDELQVA